MSIKWNVVSAVSSLTLEYKGILVTDITVDVTSRNNLDWTVTVGHLHSDGEGREEFESSAFSIPVQAVGVEAAMRCVEGIMPEIEEELRQKLDRRMRHVWRVLDAQAGQVVDSEYPNVCWRCKQEHKEVRISSGEYMRVLVLEGRTTAIPLELHKYL